MVEVKLRELMAKNKIDTIEELHQKSKLSRKAIASILSKKKPKTGLRLDTIAKLCKALNCNIEELIVIEDEQAS